MATRTQTTTKSTKPLPRSAPRQRNKGDALELLKADHRKVEKLFAEFESARKTERKQQIIETICTELTMHAALEESTFYPAVREALPDEDDLLDEAAVEHASLKWLIGQLEAEDLEDELYDAKVMVLKEYVKHHVKEEEKEMFPKIRKSALDTKELGQVLQTVKQDLQAEVTTH
ncbi:MAG TPA: hemerythrin domain-containing protein [Halioglobus sp.]